MTSTEVRDVFRLAGTTLEGRFVVDRAIAEGGFGVVYLAQQAALERPVALKVLKTPPRFEEVAKQQFLASFAAEAKTIARIVHPNIVHVHDFGVSEMPSGERAAWMALEWLTGETLDDELTRRRGRGGRSPAECLEIMRPLLSALAVVHAAGVAHRDLKPGNIMMVPGPGGTTLKLLDFGIAKMMDAEEAPGTGQTQTRSTQIAFSPGYASPEQISQGRSGPWTDVHALGLMLTELLTDRAPLEASDVGLIYQQIVDKVRPTPVKFGVMVGAWEPVLGRALAVSPGERYREAGELLKALDASVADATVTHARFAQGAVALAATHSMLASRETFGAMSTVPDPAMSGRTPAASGRAHVASGLATSYDAPASITGPARVASTTLSGTRTVTEEVVALPLAGPGRRTVVLTAALTILVLVAVAVGWRVRSGRGDADRPYEDRDAFAEHLGPRSIAVPAGLVLPEVSGGGERIEDRPFDLPPPPVSEGTLIDLFRQSPRTPTGELSWATTVIAISRDGLRVDLADLSLPLPHDSQHGFDARFKKNGISQDLYIVPLASALQWINARWLELASGTGRDAGSITILADRDTSFRVLTEVLFTAGQVGISAFRMAMLRGGRVVATLHEARQALGSAPSDASSSLSVLITKGGFEVKTPDGRVGPGCEGNADGPTIGKIMGASGADYDFASLRKCAAHLKGTSPKLSAARSAVVSAGPTILYDVAVRTMEAVRNGDNGADLFPLVSLGVAP